MKEHVDRLFGKLRSSKGETLAELLVSVLVIVLGLTMFATAMMSSKKMLVSGCTDPFHDCYSYWRRCGCSKRSI